MNIWRATSLSELIQIIFYMGLTHLGSDASCMTVDSAYKDQLLTCFSSLNSWLRTYYITLNGSELNVLNVL